MNRKKAQMFLVTVVFLSGVIFAVQGFLVQYMTMDLSEPMQSNDVFILENIRDMFGETIKTGTDCDDALLNMNLLHEFLITRMLKGYTVELKYNKENEPNLVCANWAPGATDPVLTLTVHISGTNTETTGVYEYFRST